ncbi:MAG: hypothetical protein JST00_12120 [Deltaproteobacteria bacterium]|nr:hypothetical protein [Deltaproteobacteria bacterium]
MRRVAVVGLALALGGCSKGVFIDIAMSGASREARATGMRVGDRMVLSGDMHCHVLPPDSPSHVTRDLRETVTRAEQEGLDFVVLTPHVPGEFQTDDARRTWVKESQAELRARLASIKTQVMVIPGFEYTDRRWGHLGMAFADVDAVLEAVSAEEAQRAPTRFFEQWVAKGGILTVNHPVNRPLRDPPFSELAYDLSWRAYHGAEVPPEVEWVSTHAQTIETFNASVTHLRDQFIVGEEDRSLREASHLVDRLVRRQQRRIAAVGGSDSHGGWLRPTTFVLARDRSIASLREGLVGGRTCVRGPEACTLEIRPRGAGAPWAHVGDDVPGDARPKDDPAADVIEARATGGDVTLFVNGELAGTAESGDTMSVRLPHGRCAVVRAVVGRSWSSGIYVGCHDLAVASPADMQTE